MLVQIQKINNKIKHNNYYFYYLLLVVFFNYLRLYDYLLEQNYNMVLFFFTYLFILYNYFNLFSYIILLVTITIFKLLSIDNYIKNIYIIENHEPLRVQQYRRERQLQARQQERQTRQAGQARQNYQPTSSYQAAYAASFVEEDQSTEARVQRSADERGDRLTEESRAVVATGPPDPAVQYILAHMPECGKEMISLKSLPKIP
jgi:hypothetical protein